MLGHTSQSCETLNRFIHHQNTRHSGLGCLPAQAPVDNVASWNVALVTALRCPLSTMIISNGHQLAACSMIFSGTYLGPPRAALRLPVPVTLAGRRLDSPLRRCPLPVPRPTHGSVLSVTIADARSRPSSTRTHSVTGVLPYSGRCDHWTVRSAAALLRSSLKRPAFSDPRTYSARASRVARVHAAGELSPWARARAAAFKFGA